MINPMEYLKVGQEFHGHKCPAMPLGLRVGAAAMNRLGVNRAADGQLVALVELGDDHCAHCFADGIQMITGCTYGKGNIRQLNYGKWGVTLVDRASGRAVRVVPKTEAMLANKQSDFFVTYRQKGIPASEVPSSVVEPLIARVMTAPDAALLIIGEPFASALPKKTESFSGFVCERCGEMTVEGYGRILGEQHVCIPCYDTATAGK